MGALTRRTRWFQQMDCGFFVSFCVYSYENLQTICEVAYREACSFLRSKHPSTQSPFLQRNQARHQLIDPFFEALGWDIKNREMKPLYLQEVIPEGRVKTNIGKEAREQTVKFDPKETLGKEYKDILNPRTHSGRRIQSECKEATKKPDYRFRIKGQTKFFVEAKKPIVDLMKSQDAIFQVKRYGFPAGCLFPYGFRRVPRFRLHT